MMEGKACVTRQIIIFSTVFGRPFFLPSNLPIPYSFLNLFNNFVLENQNLGCIVAGDGTKRRGYSTYM